MKNLFQAFDELDEIEIEQAIKLLVFDTPIHALVSRSAVNNNCVRHPCRCQ